MLKLKIKDYLFTANKQENILKKKVERKIKYRLIKNFKKQFYTNKSYSKLMIFHLSVNLTTN